MTIEHAYRKLISKTGFIEKSDKIIIIGTSAGGIYALKHLLSKLDKKFNLPIILIIHRLKNVKSHLDSVLQNFTFLKVKEAEEKEVVKPGFIYTSPANYHLLIESDNTFSLTVDEAINFSRPAIDVSFVSASEVYADRLLGIILTGANTDGAKGLKRIYENGGEAWVQNPSEAQVGTMPLAALELVPNALVKTLDEIAQSLSEL